MVGEAEFSLFEAAVENMTEQYGRLCESDPPLCRYKCDILRKKKTSHTNNYQLYYRISHTTVLTKKDSDVS